MSFKVQNNTDNVDLTRLAFDDVICKSSFIQSHSCLLLIYIEKRVLKLVDNMLILRKRIYANCFFCRSYDVIYR